MYIYIYIYTYIFGLHPLLDGGPKASTAIPSRPITKPCRKRAATKFWVRKQASGALRIEAVSPPKYRTLRISKGPTPKHTLLRLVLSQRGGQREAGRTALSPASM